MANKEYRRIYKDNNKYREDILPYIDALAITVQKYLFTNRNGIFYLGSTIRLYDFMTLTRYYIEASMSEFGQSDIETYISGMDDPTARFFGGEAVQYNKEDNFIILNGTPADILSLMWAAWIYARVVSDIASNDKEQIWQRAAEQLYTSMENFYDSPEHKCFEESNKLLSMADDAMKTMGTYIVEQKQKGIYAQRQQPAPAKEQQVSTGEDITLLQARIKELEAENTTLKSKLAEFLSQSKTSGIQKVGNDEWVVELFSHFCYEDTQVAQSIIDEMRDKTDPEIADIIIKRKQQNQISPKTQNRELWRILHAATFYRGIEGNLNTALRRRQQQ